MAKRTKLKGKDLETLKLLRRQVRNDLVALPEGITKDQMIEWLSNRIRSARYGETTSEEVVAHA